MNAAKLVPARNTTSAPVSVVILFAAVDPAPSLVIVRAKATELYRYRILPLVPPANPLMLYTPVGPTILPKLVPESATSTLAPLATVIFVRGNWSAETEDAVSVTTTPLLPVCEE